jgi:zinc protease
MIGAALAAILLTLPAVAPADLTEKAVLPSPGGSPSSDGVLTLPSPGNPLIAVRFVFRVGSQHDPKGKEGLAALTAAMVAEGGSKTVSYEQLLEKFYPMAAGLDAACRKEVTVFSGTIHRDNLRPYLALVSEVLVAPRFAEKDFERLRNEAIDAVSKTLRATNDEELSKWTLQCELYADHPYGHYDRGTVTALRAMTLDDVKAFHSRHYTRESLLVGLAGGFEPTTIEALEEDLKPLRTSGFELPELPQPKAPRGLEVTIVEKPAEATAIALGFPLPVTRRDDDFYALMVANSYLGEHRTFNGKLMQELRGKRGLNYGDYSYIEDFIQDGSSTFAVPNNPRRQQYFSIWIRPVPRDKAVFALRAALWELDKLLRVGISPADFEETRSFLLNYSRLWVQTPSRNLGYAIDGKLYGRQSLVAELAERLPRLTLEEVNAAARKYLQPGGMKVAIVAQNAAELREILTSNQPTPIHYDTEGTPEEVLAEDQKIAVFPLQDVRVRIVPVEQMFER